MELQDNFYIFIQENWKKVLGGLLGLIVSIIFVIFGFWKGIFIILCIAVGIFAGGRIEKSEGLQNFFNRLWNRQNRF